jgi:hypothetical protein
LLSRDDVLEKLCAAGAAAVKRYFEIAREVPHAEHFLPSYVFDHLGGQFKMTLETNGEKLRRWNTDHGGVACPSFGVPRVDLVIYDDHHLPKDKQSMFALVEFKCGYIWNYPANRKLSDRNKLIGLLQHLDKCSWGVICGYAEKGHKVWAEKQSKMAGDRWFESEELQIEGEMEPYFFGASVFDRHAQLSKTVA